MNLRFTGLNICAWAFLGSLVALYMGSEKLLIMEGALMITGAVLSLHQKPARVTNLTFKSSVDPETVTRHAERANQFTTK